MLQWRPQMSAFFLNKNALLSTQKCNTPAMEIHLPEIYKYQCYMLVTTTPLFLWHFKGALGFTQREGNKAAPVRFLYGCACKGQEKRKGNGIKVTPSSLCNLSLQLRCGFNNLDHAVFLLQHDSLQVSCGFDILLTQAYTENIWWGPGLEVSRRITRSLGEARDLQWPCALCSSPAG